MPKEAVLIPFHINDNDGNITDGAATLTATVWGDEWKYQVPQGTGIILQAGDQFSCYLADDAADEVEDDVNYSTCYVKIEVRDPSEQDIHLVFGPAMYLRVRAFQDRNETAKLQLPKPVKVYPRQWIVIVVKSTDTVEVAYSYFDLLTSKVGVPLG